MAVRPINKECVHRICSGQVVLSLAVAVKELVENSLDAGATGIEIRIKEYGSEVIEVVDNGSGIEPENFQALTLKHWTSKIQDFSDVATVGTFGFRGEALSSLCALSDVVVTTRHRDQPAATRLQYDNGGKITNQCQCAREVGTTVAVHNIFYTLPVRHKEFQRNLKKEYGRMIHMLQGYCLLTPLVRFKCYQQAGKSKKQLVLCTNGNSGILDNISNIFGQKQVQQLVELIQCPGETIPAQDGTSYLPDTFDAFRLTGYISRCTHGYGRSGCDRQFVFFNGRPCDHPKLSKTVNEVYHMYNRHQYPFVVLNVETNKGSVDVNLTPDKRAVMVHQEKALLILVKESLVMLYNSMQGEMDSNTSPATPLPSAYHNSVNGFEYHGGTEGAGGGGGGGGGDDGGSQGSYNGDPKSLVSSLKRAYSFSRSNNCHSEQQHVTKRNTKSLTLGAWGKQRAVCDMKGYSVLGHSSSRKQSNGDITVQQLNMPRGCGSGQTSELDNSTLMEQEGPLESLSPIMVDDEGKEKKNEDGEEREEENEAIILDTSDTISNKQEMTASLSLSETASRLAVMSQQYDSTKERKRSFKARIAPESNQAAEDELKKFLSKDMFQQMEVIGQFNLGFIIARLDDDLFIVDQHATDEKYNFERLQRDTVIEHQKLIQPISLELTAVNEGVIMDNMHVFRKNGFEFSVDEDAPPTKRVKLTGQPVSKNWSFGASDIDELIFLLTDSPGQMVRPSRVSAMFASRACRSSIMIGTPLSSQEMRKVLNHMSETNNPWCCPHGRPTLRHLIDLSRL